MNKILLESNEQKWNDISENAFYRSYMEELKEAANRLLLLPLKAFQYSEYQLYQENGNRLVYEGSYFSRRQRLVVYTVMYKTTKEKKWLTALQDTIWVVCDEFTWSLPAHVPPELPIGKQEIFLDLFSCETAHALSEIDFLLQDELAAPVRERITYEVRRRTLDSLLHGDQHYMWEDSDNNWAAVCAGSVGMAFLYQATEEEVTRAMVRLQPCLDHFLSGFTEDGACLEGYTYWWYGFSYFVDFASLYAQYTGGAVDLLKLPKVDKIARFQQQVIVGRDLSLCFSDNNILKFSHDRGLSHFLYHHFDGIIVPPDAYRTHFATDECARFGSALRQLLWADPELQTPERVPEPVYFPDAQWFIYNTEKYSLTAKGGHNAEPHNHNDVGSFAIATPTQYLLDDLGAAEYTKDYFRDETRYTYLVNASRGHSLPLIGGQEELADAAHRAVVLEATKQRFVLELKDAYAIPQLTRFTRSFTCDADGVTIEDHFVFDGAGLPVTERLVSRLKPEQTADGIRIASTDADSAGTALHVHCVQPSGAWTLREDTYHDHAGAPTPAYLSDFDGETAADVVYRMRFDLI